jgi:cell division protein FtsW
MDRAPERRARPGGRVIATLRLLDRPLTSYYLVLGITMLLLALGLVMVLSTSSAQAIAQGGSPYGGFQKQLLGVVIGLPLMWIAARSSPVVFRAAVYPMIAASVLGLMLVLAVGHTVLGGERWIGIMGFQVQPSEFAKLAFVLWGADLLARKEKAGPRSSACWSCSATTSAPRSSCW